MPFATQWFLVYYSILGLLLLVSGAFFTFRPDKIAGRLMVYAEREKPPVILIRILKYLILFTLPGLALSFFPFSWVELLFTVWSLILLYIAGAQLVRWKQSRMLIRHNPESLAKTIRKGGAIMMSVGFAIFLLAYLVVNRATG
ncbi:hypothetical protein [Fodinibius sediminis]|uniref:Uncharacterized protein n=1 Tax=Fodinibius sediminis TaxID=1214077 RepID=A0A521C4J0_9BACT|nr:hypothetical protein [Fodinibius sediminis]SMO54396.1 hypothetical protein SAMN06265218_10525 [Fodinibius sediminis]